MFNYFNIDKKTINIIMIILIATGILRYLNSTEAILGLLLSLPGILIAITFHEYAHAKTADILGDDTPRYEGRLNLNPFNHLDPIGFVMLLFAGIGWGKPVHVNPLKFNRTITMEKGNAIVSIAGPLTNFILAILFAIIQCLIVRSIKTFPSNSLIIIIKIISQIIIINIALGVFNLIPLPPLDGSKVIKPFLSYNVKQWFEKNEMIFYFIFIIIWVTGLVDVFISPAITSIYNGLINLLSLIIK